MENNERMILENVIKKILFQKRSCLHFFLLMK